MSNNNLTSLQNQNETKRCGSAKLPQLFPVKNSYVGTKILTDFQSCENVQGIINSLEQSEYFSINTKNNESNIDNKND